MSNNIGFPGIRILIFICAITSLNLCALNRGADTPGEELRQRREMECEQASSACALSCGTPDVLERRLDRPQAPAYIGTYMRCSAACGKRYEQCIERIKAIESTRESDTARDAPGHR